jgi:hypothetical protein
MCSSRIDEHGVVTITASGDMRYPVGMTFAVVGSSADSGRDRAFGDYLARLTLSQSGRPWHEGVRVLPPEGTLPEALAHGLVHESLVEEPRAA